MKQIVIRIIDPKVPVYYVMAGTIADGEPFERLSDEEAKEFLADRLEFVADLVHYDDLFGGIPYIRCSDLTHVVLSLTCHDCERVELYPGFLVFTFNC